MSWINHCIPPWHLKKMYCMWVVASRWRLGAWYGTPQVLLGCFDGSTYIPHCVNMAKQEKSREKNQSTQLSWVDNGFTMVHKHSAPYPKFIKSFTQSATLPPRRWWFRTSRPWRIRTLFHKFGGWCAIWSDLDFNATNCNCEPSIGYPWVVLDGLFLGLESIEAAAPKKIIKIIYIWSLWCTRI